jgi:hypothetical protein
MTGQKRLDNIQSLLKDVIDHNIAGDYIETGVWRGGSSVLAKAVLDVLEPNSQRISYVCDSFMAWVCHLGRRSCQTKMLVGCHIISVSANVCRNGSYYMLTYYYLK